MSAAVIPLDPRIRALFGRRPRIAEPAIDVEIPPIPDRNGGTESQTSIPTGQRTDADIDAAREHGQRKGRCAEDAGASESRPWAGAGHGRAAARGAPTGQPQQPDAPLSRPIRDGDDSRPCDTEPAA